MIKKYTQVRLNRTILNYISIIGLWDNDKKIDNTILKYFNMNLLLKIDDLNKDKNYFIDFYLDEFANCVDVKIDNDYFHLMVNDIYEIYSNIDNIYNQQNKIVKDILLNMTENDESYIDNYINEIFKDFKNNFILLLINYNSKRDDYNNIKIKVLTDKMNEYANDELYEEAALLRDKIKSLTIYNVKKN